MTYSSCLDGQQDLYWGNVSRDTGEQSQESQGSFNFCFWNIFTSAGKVFFGGGGGGGVLGGGCGAVVLGILGSS